MCGQHLKVPRGGSVDKTLLERIEENSQALSAAFQAGDMAAYRELAEIESEYLRELQAGWRSGSP